MGFDRYVDLRPIGVFDGIDSPLGHVRAGDVGDVVVRKTRVVDYAFGTRCRSGTRSSPNGPPPGPRPPAGGMVVPDRGRERVEDVPVRRAAVRSDVPEIAALMRRSVLQLFPRFHDERETAAAARYLTEPDVVLVDDGTYYVHEVAGEVVACGGWSKRDKLYTGSGDRPTDGRLLDPATEPARVRAMFVHPDWTRRGLGRAVLAACARDARAAGFRSLVLVATLPGAPLYRSFGFREVRRTQVLLPDGVTLAGLEMACSLD